MWKSCHSNVGAHKYGFLEHSHAYPEMYGPWLADFTLQWQSWVVVSETTWFEKPKIFTIGPFRGKAY